MASNDLIEAGNIDLHNRPVTKNADGSVSTVQSMSFNEQAEEYLPKAQVRTDGPNTTATTSTYQFNTGPGTFSMDTEDTPVDGVNSRVVTNMQASVDEDELPSVPEYTAKAVDASLKDALQSGHTQLVTPVDNESQAFDYRRIARENGAVYSETEYQGKRHAVIAASDTPPVNSQDDSFKAADAISKGYKPEEVRAFLAQQGYDNAQLDRVTNQANQIVTARNSGYDDDAIRGYLNDNQTKVIDTVKQPKQQDDGPEWQASGLTTNDEPTMQERILAAQTSGMSRQVTPVAKSVLADKQAAMSSLMGSQEVSAEELLNSLQVIAPSMVSMTTRTSGFFGNQEAANKVAAANQASRQKIIGLAAKRGLNLEWSDEAGSFVANTPNGAVPIDDSTWDSLVAQGGELAGGVAGGIAGARVGAAVGAGAGPWGVLGGGAIGSVLGAAGGAAAGSQFDYLYQAIKLQENVEGSVMANKALTAAESSAVGDIIGFGVFKSGAGLVNTIKRVKDFVIDGNSAGAYRALKDYEFISDDQAANMVSALKRLQATDTPAARNSAEEAIRAGAATRQGSEGLVQAAASYNPRVGSAVARAIDQRAQDLLATTGEASGDNLGRILREDLGNYVTDVKQQYFNVTAQAAQSSKASNFRFDFDSLAIDPVLNQLQNNIMDPTVLEKFALQASKVRDMADGRTFSDLLDLRHLVNDFRFNKNITKAGDMKGLNDVMANIDSQINNGAQYVFDKPNDWLSEFAQARIDYAKMKSVEENVMFRALNKPGVNAEDVTRNLTRYISALDGTFTDLVQKLPNEMKVRVENAAIDTLSNKYTEGAVGGIRATNFPALAKELAAVPLTTPVARQMKAAITELSEVFQNDVPLSRITSNVQVPKFQSYLTTDAVARAKYELASGVFNYVKTLFPGQSQRMLALVRKTSKLLENPLNAKTMREIMDMSAGQVDISPQVIKMQQEAARAAAAGKDATMPKVRIYGNGAVVSVRSNPSTNPDGTIAIHRIANSNDISRIAAQYGINVSDKKVMDDALVSSGYKAVQQGTDKIRLLKGR